MFRGPSYARELMNFTTALVVADVFVSTVYFLVSGAVGQCHEVWGVIKSGCARAASKALISFERTVKNTYGPRAPRLQVTHVYCTSSSESFKYPQLGYSPTANDGIIVDRFNALIENRKYCESFRGGISEAMLGVLVAGRDVIEGTVMLVRSIDILGKACSTVFDTTLDDSSIVCYPFVPVLQLCEGVPEEAPWIKIEFDSGEVVNLPPELTKDAFMRWGCQVDPAHHEIFTRDVCSDLPCDFFDPDLRFTRVARVEVGWFATNE